MSIWYSTTSSHLNISAKVKQVTSQNGLKDGREILGTRHDAAQDGEMPLETLTDGEGSGGGVHGRDILCVDKFFLQREVLSVVEVPIAQVLSEQRVAVLRPVLLNVGEIQIVHEENQFLPRRRAEYFTGSFFDGVFDLDLEGG